MIRICYIVALTACSNLVLANPCTDFDKATRMSVASFESQSSTVMKSMETPTPSTFAAFQKFNAELESTLLPAMSLLFRKVHSGVAKVYVGQFNKARTYAKDGGDGLRIVFIYEKDDLLISAISFWHFDPEQKKFILKTRDGFRGRVSIGKEKTEWGVREHFAGLSFELFQNQNKDLSIRAGEYLETSGKTKDEITYETLPHNCIGCHSSGAIKGFYSDETFEKESYTIKDLEEVYNLNSAYFVEALNAPLSHFDTSQLEQAIAHRCSEVFTLRP